MAEKSDLVQIKRNIETCIGERVQLRSNKGRKKFLLVRALLKTLIQVFSLSGLKMNMK